MPDGAERSSGLKAKQDTVRWETIDWSRVAAKIKRLKERIFRATRDCEWRKVRSLQNLLVRSRDALLLAIRKVTQENDGRFTAGIDGKIYANNKAREEFFVELRGKSLSAHKPAPVRRVRIPKPGKEEKRLLGMPNQDDRVFQALVKFALEPEWEYKFEQNSYGFRPGRRTMDAVVQIRESIKARGGKKTSEWILEMDIRKCFDTIDHEALLEKISNFKEPIRRWLKAGAVEFGKHYKTIKGTPQGGIISPLLANIALDGMERLFGAYTKNGNYINPAYRRGKNKGISLIRYADDSVGIASSRESIITHVIPKLRDFLAGMGMELNNAKTRIVHRTEGFDFLGFRIQQFISVGNKFCVIKPSKDRVKLFLQKVKRILMMNKQATQEDIIKILNPVIRGWVHYFKHCHAKKTFVYIDFRIYKMLWWWCMRRHKKENKGKQWVKRKYFRCIGTRNWVFADSDDHQLFYASYLIVNSRGYNKVKGRNSPMDPDLHDYWLKRHGKIPQYA